MESKLIEVVGPQGRLRIESKDLPRYKSMGCVLLEEYESACKETKPKSKSKDTLADLT